MLKKAFSMIELSIVIVIIGLLAVGITAGSYLITAAELRSVITEKERYTSAVETFFSKYQAYPGDFDNAWSYWPGQNGCISQNNCDGNSNGRIEWMANSANDEALKAWTHLALAEMISGTYDGSSSNGIASLNQPNNNIPVSKRSNSGWIMDFDNVTPADSAIFDNNNVLMYGTPANSGIVNPSLNGSEAYNIDIKIDDGFPNAGAIRATGNIGVTSTSCRQGRAATDVYNSDGSDPSCVLRIKL